MAILIYFIPLIISYFILAKVFGRGIVFLISIAGVIYGLSSHCPDELVGVVVVSFGLYTVMILGDLTHVAMTTNTNSK